MSVEPDQRANGSANERKPGKSHRETMRALWLPSPEAPANDNDRGMVWAAYAFFRRHMYWLIPTALLTALSLTLLSLNHH